MKLIRTDHVRAGDLIAGTGASGDYDGGARRVATISRAPVHEKRADRMTAWQITWTAGQPSVVYYGDTKLWLQQRP